GNVAVVIACRSSDIEHDPRLRELATVGRPPTVELGGLSEETVLEVLNRESMNPIDPSSSQLEMLRLPQNLHLFLNIDPARRGGFRSPKDLLDLYWDTKQSRVRALTGEPASEWPLTIAALCDVLSSSE